MAEFRLEGLGLHSGAAGRVCARSGSGGAIVLVTRSGRRWELGPEAPRAAFGARCTALEGARTLEHALGALIGLGVGGVELTLEEGEEVPGAGGDAARWAAGLGAVAQAPLRRWAPPVALEVRLGDAWARWLPGGPELEVRARVDFPGSVIGQQETALTLDPATFLREIAPARTFAPVASQEEARALQAAGVGAGLREGEALLAGPTSWLGSQPRWDDEPVRHKVLDLLGDLGLLGVRPAGRIEVERGGHRLHRALARAAAPLLAA